MQHTVNARTSILAQMHLFAAVEASGGSRDLARDETRAQASVAAKDHGWDTSIVFTYI